MPSTLATCFQTQKRTSVHREKSYRLCPTQDLRKIWNFWPIYSPGFPPKNMQFFDRKSKNNEPNMEWVTSLNS